jgi:hypothetical protein
MNRFPEPIDHVFFLCDPSREPERAAYILNWLRENNIDKKCYTMTLPFWGSDLNAEDAHRSWNPWQNRKPVEKERNFNSYNLKPSEVSLGMNYHSLFKLACDPEKSYKVVCMFESDILFEENFLEKLGMVMKPLVSQEWDFLSIGGRADLRPRREKGDTRYGWFGHIPYYHTRTTDAMVFNVSMLRKILGTYIPFAEIIDWELNYQLELHKSRTLWLDPPICKQGSGSGEYATSL